MKTYIAALSTALVMGLASISPTTAMERPSRYTTFNPYDVDTTHSIQADRRAPSSFGCPMSSAAEGNANQQTREVMQYGQTSGGSRC
ncbi:hypothetical protein [Methylobacterium sp. 10]|uniref:hypothetical protein n=1 Tax=Methylobacterium sp. 10 TaxID=1101191 RepID=UPI0004896D58|nr:hypothetical protein [Methylobacterium sp. 10]